ncbi:MAG: metal ABC transporter permease [Deltaproteobacteria bacterium]|nr:metal ABC transporter permease [Deltaproteobacteria bacterium]MBW1960268.1 metal ABC transporter permease [Deltaproteobacteria bacterium]MBW1993678.1 metal ABC transporter permease [Deltaproteobacteria bacterium]MBW2150319.1 metal ABC transporter permease [Deltaproteobacteria bacterium]
MLEILQYEFMRNALLAGLVASLTCGIIGTLIVVNRLVFLSGGIAHTAYGGIGIAFYFGLPYLVGTIGFSLLAAVIMAAVSLKARHRSDTIIGVMWAFGMAVGVIFLDLTPGYRADLMSYLFGSILSVPNSELLQMMAVGIGVFCLIIYFYNDFLAMSYDEEFALLRGVPVRGLFFLLIIMTTLSIIMVIRVVGLILAIALLTIPPFIAEKFSTSLAKMMFFSSALCAVFCVVGLWLSYLFNLTSGATIIMVAGAGFFVALIVEWLQSRYETALSSK